MAIAPPPRNGQGNALPPSLRSYAEESGYRRLVEIAAQDDAEREAGIRLLKVITGDPKQRYIALTFDDGPHPGHTEPLLDLLRRIGVPATFFVVGKQAEKYPNLVAKTALLGHEIGNHTYNHYRLPRIPLEEVATELNTARDVLTDILGTRTRLFRPPGGEYNPAILRVAEINGYVTVLWTDDPADYRVGTSPKMVRDLVLRDITPGGIILLHDGVGSTMAALPDMVAQLRKRGFIFVTVSELIQRGGGLKHVRDIRYSRTSAL